MPNVLQLTRTTLGRYGLPGLYTGLPAVCAGAVGKAGVRFSAYEGFKRGLGDGEVSQGRGRGEGKGMGEEGDADGLGLDRGRLVGRRVCLVSGFWRRGVGKGRNADDGVSWGDTAGLGAGMMEALLVVTPSETLKCVFPPPFFPFPL